MIGDLYSYTFASEVLFRDLDQDPLALSIPNMPSWLTLIGEALSGIPVSGHQGQYDLTLRAFDGHASVDMAFTLTVPNRAPVVAASLQDYSFKSGTIVNLTIPTTTFVDADKDPLVLSAWQTGTTALPSWLAFYPSNSSFYGLSPFGDLSTISLIIEAKDGQNATATISFKLSLINARPEVFAGLSAQTIKAGKTFSYQFAADTFKDSDDALTYTATLSDGSPLPAWLSFDAKTRTFSGTPIYGLAPYCKDYFLTTMVEEMRSYIRHLKQMTD